jgi:hypothetical protein
MAIPNKQIGWSNESNLIWEISRQLEQLIGVANIISVTTTTTTTLAPYKVYTALLTQSGVSNPPTAVVLENTIGNIVWSYISTGLYKGTLTGAFPEDETAMFITSSRWNGDAIMYISLAGGDVPNGVVVETLDVPSYTSADDLLYKTTVEIRVYN